MPRLSEFYGIVIYMYFQDHPPPHFHAIYGDFEATVNVNTLGIEDGSLPRNARKLVLEWAGLHQEELVSNWALAATGNPLVSIPPLD